MVQNDVIQSRVEGVIYGAEIESIKPVSDSAYEVTLSLPQAIANDIKRRISKKYRVAQAH